MPRIAPIVAELAKPFIERFGANGAKAFVEGKSLIDCYADQLAFMREVADMLETENDELRRRLAATSKVNRDVRV